ncbi:MAG: SBBP repeat-containing protein [Actinomycetota bacterium]|nr:SBBP repeat-containing protein [Actinomycetota bacterium]
MREGKAIAVGKDGSLYVAGYSRTSDGFVTTPGAYDADSNGQDDAFVTKFDPAGSVVYSTFVGGGGSEFPQSIAVENDGSVLVTGTTFSEDFPTTPGALDRDSTPHGDYASAFLTRLSPDGSTLEFSTFIPGADRGLAVAVSDHGAVFAAGEANANFIPSNNAPDRSREAIEGFVVKISEDGRQLVWSTLVGGSSDDFLTELEIDGDGSVYVAGTTDSEDFPTTLGAYDPTFNGHWNDGFVTKIDPNSAQFEFSTMFGGYESADPEAEQSLDGLEVTKNESVYIAGSIPSDDLPLTSDAFDSTHEGSSEGYLTGFSPSGSDVAYSTYVGGDQNESLLDIDTDSRGDVFAVGSTRSTDFPTAAEQIHGAFLMKLDGTRPIYSPLGAFHPISLVVDPASSAFVAGYPAGGGSQFSSSTMPRSASRGAAVSRRIIECTLEGTPDDDVLKGTARPDLICPLAGADEVRSLAGHDIVLGAGDRDVIAGGSGHDLLVSGRGAATLRGGGASDFLIGSPVADRISAGAGIDVVLGRAGGDLLHGNKGRDLLTTGSGADQVDGGSDRDRIRTGNGPDRAWGNAGNDFLFGGNNGDLLDGGLGFDGCKGGAGSDRVRACEGHN